MRGLFGTKKTVAAPPPRVPPPEPPEDEELRARLTTKEIEIYQAAVKLLWHFYAPEDSGKPEGRPREFPGPIDETIEDSFKELERAALLETIPTFSDFSITAKLTSLGLRVMEGQRNPGRLAPASITDPATGAVTVYREVNLGFE